MNTQTLRSLISTGLLLGSAAAASAASSIVTFQVDMSTASFNASTQYVVVRGNFNGWGTTQTVLTNNPNGANPNLWTGTTNIPLNSSVIAYKYVIEPGDGYESSHNRLVTLPSNSGGTVTAPQVYYNDNPPTPITNSVTFQVDMAQQVNVGAFDPIAGVVQARGGFNGWGPPGAVASTNDPTILRTNQFGLVTSNVFVYTYEISGSPGQTLDFKYHIDLNDNWESPAPNTGDPDDSNNRFFNLSTNPTQVLPIVFFSDAAYAPVATNVVTFQVDMSSQMVAGWDPSVDTIEVRGDFNSWGNIQVLCTNNPSAPNTNIYSAVGTVVDGVGANHAYKFFSAQIANNGGWEIVAGNPALNRTYQIIDGPSHNASQVLGPFLFSDTYVDPASRLSAATTVTFTVNMTNAVSFDGSLGRPFDPTLDSVNINGVPAPFLAWGAGLPTCTNNPVGSELYSIDILLPKGSPVQQVYKYGIDEMDNEAPAGQNHVRYVRSTGTYVMPTDTFGKQLVEQYLTAVPSTPGHVMVTWGPGTHLQSRTSLSSGAWTDHPETIGMHSTNWPSGSGATFFRVFSP